MRWFLSVTVAAFTAFAVPPPADAVGDPIPIEAPGAIETSPDLLQEAPTAVGIDSADWPSILVDPQQWLEWTLAEMPPPGEALRFTTSFLNDGEDSFEIVGLPLGSAATEPGIATMEALQCESFAGPEVRGARRACVAYRRVGTMSWDPNHMHVHLQDFASYRLHHVAPDDSIGPVEREGEKIGFCINDVNPTARVWSESPLGAPNAGAWTDWTRSWYRGCFQPPMPGAAYRQGLSPGWRDVYFYSYPNQQVSIEGVPDGEHYLVNELNPTGRFLDADPSNNTAWVRLRLGTDEAGKRTVTELDRWEPTPKHPR